MMRMKEFWFFQANLFEENPKAFKNIFKSKTEEDFLAAIEEIEAGRPLTDARFRLEKAIVTDSKNLLRRSLRGFLSDIESHQIQSEYGHEKNQSRCTLNRYRFIRIHACRC